MTLDRNLEDCIWGRYDWIAYTKQLVAERVEPGDLLERIDVVKENIGKQIRKAVEQHHPRLVEQASALQNLDRVHAAIGREMAHLHDTCEQLSTSYQSCYDQVRLQTFSLEQLYALRRILYSANKCEQLIRKIDSTKELVKRSELVCELEAIAAESPNLKEIVRIREALLVTIPKILKDAREETINQLKSSMKTLNAPMISSCVCALRNLSCYDIVIAQLLDENSKRIDALFLQLSINVDGATKLLPEVSNQVQLVLERFALLGPEVLRSCSECIAKIIAQRVPENAPHAARVLHWMCKASAVHVRECVQPIEQALRPLRRAVLAQALSRMSNTVNSTLDEPNISGSSAQQIITTIKNELSAVDWDVSLRSEMDTNIAKVLQMVAQKIEMRLSLDEKTLHLGERLSNAQTVNYNLLSVAQAVSDTWPQFGRPLLQLVCQARESIVARARSTAATIIASMHTEPLGRPSPYVKELCDYLNALRVHAAWFMQRRDGEELIAAYVTHVAEMFVASVSLMRPWSDERGSQLVADFEYIITHGLTPLLDAKRWSQTLSQIVDWKNALEQSVQQLADSENLPIWLIVHLLIARCDQSLLSPNRSVDWSVTEYLNWLAEHDNIERRNFLHSLINSYATSVFASGRTEYVEYYPLINNVLQRTLNN